MHIQDIPSRAVPALAKILQCRPNENRNALAQRVSHEAKALPFSIRSSSLERLLLPSKGHPCEVHKCLNPEAACTILHHIQLEVGIRLNEVVEHSSLLAPEHYARVTRLRALHALWLNSRDYRKTFKTSPRNTKWRFRADRCEACIISQITGDLVILLDLRWAFRSRATRAFVMKHGHPRLQQWCQIWICALAGYVEGVTGTGIDLDLVLLHNEKEAIQLKKTRVMIAATTCISNYRKHGTTNDGYVTEYPPNYSFPIATSPHKPQPQLASLPEDMDAAQVENCANDANEAEIEGMDPFKALTSTPHLPLAAESRLSRLVTDSTMTMTTVSADMSTKGQSPYQHKAARKPDLESIRGVGIVGEEDDVAAAHEADALYEYIPPRSQWSKIPDEPALRSSAVLPLFEEVPEEHRPSSRLSQDTWEKSITSNGSWETEQCRAAETASSIYPPPRTTKPHQSYVSPSESWYSLSKVAQQTRQNRPKHRAGRQKDASTATESTDPAKTFLNVLPKDSPYSDSKSTIRGPTQKAPKAEKVRHPDAFDVSSLFMNLYNEVSHPMDSPARRPTTSHSSSATRSKQVEAGADVSRPFDHNGSRHDRRNRPSKAQPPSQGTQRDISKSTAHFLELYDEVVSSYIRLEESHSSAVSISPTLRRNLTSKALKPRKHPEKNVDSATAGLSDLRRAHSIASKLTRKDIANRLAPPSLTSQTTLSSGSSDNSTVQGEMSQPTVKAPGRSKLGQFVQADPDDRSMRSGQTTWTSQLQNDSPPKARRR
jgi:hypothetical protein